MGYFKELQIIKSAWKDSVVDLAQWNSSEVEDIELEDFMEYLNADLEWDKWDSEASVDI